MSIERIDAWKAVCDGPCGKTLEDDIFTFWIPREGLEEIIEASEWWKRGEKTYCPDCGVPDCAACGHLYGSHDYGEHHCEDCDCAAHQDEAPDLSGDTAVSEVTETGTEGEQK